ncbi:MAG: diguanylate cyclase [bacterium]|nr:diguanylate cyclase [bacterium]
MNSIRVLFVDDDRITRIAISRVLAKKNPAFSFDEAHTGAIALEKLQEHDYDCVILDYVLPDRNGLEVLKEIISKEIEVPVIMLTGQGDEMTAVQALKDGAYDYLPKSILFTGEYSKILTSAILHAIELHKTKDACQTSMTALEMSEERYRSLVQNSPILILRIFPDDYTISFVNNGYCNYFSTKELEVVGELFLETINTDQERQKYISGLMATLSKKNPVVCFENHSTIEEMEKWQIWSLQAIYDENENLIEYQCMGEDITIQKLAEREYYNQKIYLQSVLDSQDHMIVVTTRDEIILGNNSFLSFFGYKTLNDFNRKIKSIGELAVEIEDYISKPDNGNWLNIDFENPDNQNLVAFQPEGLTSPRIFSINISLLSVDDQGYVITFTDVTELEQRSMKLEEKASYDPLTKIFNRSKFDELLVSEIERSQRYYNSLSIIFFDIDHFKRINDTYGHQIGDSVLRNLAFLVQRNIRKADIFARWGGEEFVLVLPQTEVKGAAIVAEKLRVSIRQFEFEEVGQVTISFGVTSLTDTDTAEELLSRSDKALYKAKEAGRDRVITIGS